MFEVLKDILMSSHLLSLFTIKKEDDRRHLPTPNIGYRVETNIYRIHGFELWGTDNDFKFRVYHSKDIDNNLQSSLNELNCVISNSKQYVDFKSNDYISIARDIKSILENNNVIESCEETKPRAKTSKFEGLDLPDIDTSQNDIIGQTFTWRDIISIWEDNSESNILKQQLSQNGIYIQRSKDGKSRYIGSAYGQDGIIGRWMKHLNSNGDAQHLNLFILENGYNKIIFSVIEFYNKEDIIKRESTWKNILGTINTSSYNGIQLNKN